MRAFEVIFPLIYYEGSFVFSPQFSLSAHGETCYGLMSAEEASGELCLRAERADGAELPPENSGKKLFGF